MAEEAWQGREEEMVEEAATSIFQKIVRYRTGYFLKQRLIPVLL